MIRFILRAAFLLGVIAFFLPGGRSGEDGPALNYFQAFAGLQEAMSDLGGFCDRAPTACNAAGQIAGFVANRIGDGLEFGYRAVAGPAGAPSPQPAHTVQTVQPVEPLPGPVRGAPGNAGAVAGPAAVPAPSPRPFGTATGNP